MMLEMEFVVYCADVGSIKGGNFAWACVANPERPLDKKASSDIEALASAVANDLNAERHVALGFEAPIFVPVPYEPSELGSAREGEGSRPWSAGAGAAILPTAIVQAAWLLRYLREDCPAAAAFTSWSEFSNASHGLYVWEAFVSHKAEKTGHYEDALAGAREFARVAQSGRDPAEDSAIAGDGPVLSLVGAALLWAGWTENPAALSAVSPVIRAASGTSGH